MKRFLAALVVLVAAVPVAANAASFVISPASGSYNTGDLITITLSVDPEGSAIYTSMLDARFSSGVFEVVSFTPNNSMLSLNQSGYDAIDNTNGILTKTGGYTGGATTLSQFGTLVIRAKAAGAGTFVIADSSKLYDANNIDQQSGPRTYSYTIANGAPAVTQEQTPPIQLAATPAQTRPSPQPLVETDEEVLGVATIVGEEEGATSTQLAAAGTAAADSSLWWIVLGILAVAAAFGGGYFAGTRRLWK